MSGKTDAISTPQTPPIGLIAGWGRFPVAVAEGLRRSGHTVVCAGIHGHVDPCLAYECAAFRSFGLTRLGAQIRFLRRHGVQQAIFAGKILKTILFQPAFLWNYLPDWECVRAYYPHFITRRRDRTDDSLLTAAVRAFERRGIEILPAWRLLPELLLQDESFGNRSVTPRQQEDIQFGWRLAKEMGRLDIGQTVAVKGQAVLAVEAVEGTDECIRRAGHLCPSGGFVVVKVAKPQQDMRFDMPTIGLGTLQALHESGASVLAVEADKTILIDRQDVVRFARQHRISVVSIHAPDASQRHGPSISMPTHGGLRAAG